MSDVTRILNAIEEGDTRAADELIPLVYEELRQLAAQKLAQESPGQTLQPTALVHEAYIRLVGSEDQNWQNRGHFFKAAADIMRRILIENARRKKSLNRGGSQQKIKMNEVFLAIEDPPQDDLLALDEALSQLAREDPRVSELVNLRYFAGLTLDQIAQIMKITRRTADRYWALGKAWLYQKMSEGETEWE